VLLVDRQALFLAALAELLTAAGLGATVETTTDSKAALEKLANDPVDLLFCEVRSEPLGGAEIAARVHGLKAKARVILLADPEDRALLVAALSCGAVGFFTKDASPEEFLEGVEAVLAGHFVLGHDLIHTTLNRLARPGASTRAHPRGQLSRVERDILVMVGRAASVPAIAQSRGISQKTVRTHLTSIYRKLRVRNRSEAILWLARTALDDQARLES
jgi:DNA-binding NarL/FixJ family response regulator